MSSYWGRNKEPGQITLFTSIRKPWLGTGEKAQLVKSLLWVQIWAFTCRTSYIATCTCNPALGRQRQGNTWGLAIRYSSQNGELQVQWGTLSQKMRWRTIEEDSGHQPLTYTRIHINLHTHMNMWTPCIYTPHTHTYTHRWKTMVSQSIEIGGQEIRSTLNWNVRKRNSRL